ncbi:hypothetical protein BC830DRAFT_1126646 [Chytriomyces sp. MP71]|nr:hypothetical protein BC830DRAFT_1126646 [Chytriomyces sp. MP71]
MRPRAQCTFLPKRIYSSIINYEIRPIPRSSLPGPGPLTRARHDVLALHSCAPWRHSERLERHAQPLQ